MKSDLNDLNRIDWGKQCFSQEAQGGPGWPRVAQGIGLILALSEGQAEERKEMDDPEVDEATVNI